MSGDPQKPKNKIEKSSKSKPYSTPSGTPIPSKIVTRSQSISTEEFTGAQSLELQKDIKLTSDSARVVLERTDIKEISSESPRKKSLTPRDFTPKTQLFVPRAQLPRTPPQTPIDSSSGFTPTRQLTRTPPPITPPKPISNPPPSIFQTNQNTSKSTRRAIYFI